MASETYNTQSDIVLFGETNFRNRAVRFGIKTDDRRRHMYLIGKTGMGKSTIIENMVISDIIAGRGVAVVDPHGDLVEKIIDYIPSHRVNDTIYFNPADQDYPIAFNVLESQNEQQKHLVASGLIGVFKKIWADSWGPRLEYVLRNAVLGLMDYPGSTLLGVMRILTDKGYRAKVIEQIKDPVVRSFWVDEYSKYPDKFQAEAIAPIQNKVGQFLSSAIIRNIVGQVKSTLDLREVMDNKKILLMNLSKGRIGEDNSALLGAMMITKIQLAAMSRVDILEDTRKDFYLYVDEFQNFATESFANILSEARKYRLNLIIAHQYIEQVPEEVRSAVFGNVGTLICFRVGAEDSEFLAKEFMPVFTEIDLVNLPKWEVYLKLMIDGIASEPFSAKTLPPLPIEKGGQRDKIIRISRERYANNVLEVEDKIMRWSGMKMDDAPRTLILPAGAMQANAGQNNVVAISKSHKPTEQRYKAVCSDCGKQTTVPFQPDGDRPLYCEECYPQHKGEKKLDSAKLTKQNNQPVVQPHTSMSLPAVQDKDADKRMKNKSMPPKRDAQPVVVQTGSAISLKQALARKPVAFKNGRNP